MTGRDVNHVTGRGHARKYVLRMRNRKLRNTRPSGAYWPEVTGSDVRLTSPEEALSGSMFCACPVFTPRFFLSRSTKCWLEVFSTTSASYNHRKLPPFYIDTFIYVEILEMKIILRVSVQQSRWMIKLVPYVNSDVREKTSCCDIIETKTESQV